MASAYLAPRLHDDDRSPGGAAWVLVLGVLGAELVGWLFLHTDWMRALLVIVAIAGCSLIVAVKSRLLIPTDWINANGGAIKGSVVYTLLGMYGVALALVNRNGPYYILSDIYHWFGEGLLVAIVTVALLRSLSSHALMWLLSVAGVLFGALALVCAAAGTLGLPLAGGHVINYLHIWRLEAGRGFPTVPLLLVTAILTRGNPRGTLRLVAWVALLVLLASLAITFKRSQWLTYAFLVAMFLMPQRWQLLTRCTALVVGAFAIVLMLLVPRGFETAKTQFLELITYNPSYDTADALESRGEQYRTIVPHIVDRPAGHGFGAKIYVFTPSKNEQAEVHYVHNGYLYYGVQLGIGATALTLLLLAAMALSLFRRFGADPQWDWALHGAFAGLCALSIMSLVLVAFHTPLLGFLAGLAAVALEHARSRTPAAPQAAPALRAWPRYDTAL